MTVLVHSHYAMKIGGARGENHISKSIFKEHQSQCLMREEIKAHFFALLRFKLDGFRDAQKPTTLGPNTRSGSTQQVGTTNARPVILSNQSCLS